MFKPDPAVIAAITEALAINPYTPYGFVAQNADVERMRATKYARLIAQETYRLLSSHDSTGAKP